MVSKLSCNLLIRSIAPGSSTIEDIIKYNEAHSMLLSLRCCGVTGLLKNNKVITSICFNIVTL